MRYIGRRVVSLVAVAFLLPSFALAATGAGDPWIRFAPQAELFQVVSYIDAPNTRSITLAERMGAICDPEPLPDTGDDVVLVYRHKRPGAAA